MLFLQMAGSQAGYQPCTSIRPGGSVTAGLAIYDTMQFVTCDVATYCMGIAASMGAVLLAAGTQGKRYALPNSDIMIHQVSGGAQGTASDVERTVEWMFKIKKRLIHILPATPANQMNRCRLIPIEITGCPQMKRRPTG